MTTLEADAAALDPTVDYIEALADRLLGATPERRAEFLRRLDTPKRVLVKKALDRRADPHGFAVYRTLGYEPICVPRVKVALELGYANPVEAEDAGATLPPMCGECPAERLERSTAFDVLYGGAAGGSKTKSTLMFGIRCMARYPGLRCLLLRETFDELDENVYPELRAIDYAADIGGKWNAGRKQLEIGTGSNPSVMRFRYMGDLGDIRRRRGGSYQLIILDERNQLPPGTGDGLRDRLRSANARIPVIGLRSTANPGGKSHSELKKNYIVPSDYGAHPVEVKNADTGATFTREFIPAKATDNPYLGAAYFDEVLGGIEDPVLRAAMRDGDWDKFAGQFFAEWDHGRHVVPRDAVGLADSWLRYEGIDYGRAAPFCMLRAAVDGDGRVWLYRELYRAGLDETVQAKLIVDDEAACGDRDARRAGDPSMWNRNSEAPSIADKYDEHGVKMHKADNDRTIGWARVHSFLGEGEPCTYHAAAGWVSCPMLHVLEATCPNLVRTLPDLPFDPHKVEDLDTSSEDHAVDALRYLLMQLKAPRRRRRLAGEAQRAAAATA